MKTQRTLAILWLAGFIAGPCYWLLQFLNNSAAAYDGIHALLSLVCPFGGVASIFLFQGAKWARIAIGSIALFFAVDQIFDIWHRGWMWRDKWADNAMCILGLATVALLFFRRYEPAT